MSIASAKVRPTYPPMLGPCYRWGEGGDGIVPGRAPHPLLPGHLVRQVLSDGQRNVTGARGRTPGLSKPGHVEPLHEAAVVVEEGDRSNSVRFRFASIEEPP